MTKLTIVMMCMVLVGPLVADDRAQKTTGHEPIPTTTGDESTTVFLTVGGGLALLSGNTGYSINVGGLTQVLTETPLYVGADLGLNFWSYKSTTGISSSGATGIQLLPTAIYRFQIAGLPSIYPYLGISVGPNVFMERVTPTVGTSVSNTSVYFEGLIRPGFFVSLSKGVALNLEPKFGILKSDFIFLPQVNATFSL